MSEWQPIETAPRDGTPILIYDPTKLNYSRHNLTRTFDNPRYAIACYRVWKKHGRWMWGNRTTSLCSPTHWMPLPEPPTQEEP